jgi:hypothetical protein
MRRLTQIVLLTAIPVAATAQTSLPVPEEAPAQEGSADAEEASVETPTDATQPPLIQPPPPQPAQPAQQARSNCGSVAQQTGTEEILVEGKGKGAQIAEETGTAVGSTVGTGLGAAVAGPIGAAAGSVLIGHVGKAVTSVFKGKGKKKRKAERTAQNMTPPGCEVAERAR